MNNIYNEFSLEKNKSYDWILSEGLINTINKSPISPWYHVEEVKWLHDMFPNQEESLKLLLFARRQDCDDLACFNILNGKIVAVYLVQGWVKNGYRIVEKYEDIWQWLKVVIDDIKLLAES